MSPTLSRLLHALMNEPWPAWYDEVRLVLADWYEQEGWIEESRWLRETPPGIVVHLGNGTLTNLKVVNDCYSGPIHAEVIGGASTLKFTVPSFSERTWDAASRTSSILLSNLGAVLLTISDEASRGFSGGSVRLTACGILQVGLPLYNETISTEALAIRCSYHSTYKVEDILSSHRARIRLQVISAAEARNPAPPSAAARPAPA